MYPGSLNALAGNGHRVLALIGRYDPLIMLADVRALDATGVQVVRYYEAEHAFAHEPGRSSHRPADAADACPRVAEAVVRLG